MKQPLIISNFLSEEDFKQLQDYVKGLDKSTLGHSDQFNRYEFGGSEILDSLHKKTNTYSQGLL